MTRRKLLISLAIGCALSSVALYFSLRNVPFKELGQYLGQINYWWALPTAGLITVSFILRVVRWQIILSQTGNVSFWQAFHPLMIGFMMNCILPGRVGEFARPLILKKDHQISVFTGLATIAAERAFDIVILVILFAIVFSKIAKHPDLKGTFGDYHLSAQDFRLAAWLTIRLSFLAIAFIIMLSIEKTRRIITTVILKIGRFKVFTGLRIVKYTEKTAIFFVQLIEKFSSGLSLVYHPKQLLACMALTALIWAISAFSYIVFAYGFPGIDLGFWDMATVMVIICIFIALPSVPGFWGLWEAGGVFALSLFGILSKEASAYTLTNHALQLLPVIIIGLGSALMTGVNFIHLLDNKKLTSAIQ
ncbi:MAG: flippase-like domain-containing protein [Desulfobacteraceae bacterium]|nr:flippase-like domain-containing protein [Desulfobacteraceae bacterium]